MVQRKQRNERRDRRQRKCACTCKKKRRRKRVLDTKREKALRESEIKEGKDSKKSMAVDFAH